MTLDQQNQQKMDNQRFYLTLGLIAVIGLACIGAFAYSVGQVTSVVPTAPTNTPLPPPVVSIQSIKSQAELSTVEYSTLTEVYNETPPEGFIDGLGQGAPIPDVFFQQGPEKAVVEVPAAMVADSRAYGLGDFVEIGDQLCGAEIVQGLMVLDRCVEFVDIGLMMPGVMDFHGARIDIGFQGVIGI